MKVGDLYSFWISLMRFSRMEAKSLSSSLSSSSKRASSSESASKSRELEYRQ
jgi:hypothetical protein